VKRLLAVAACAALAAGMAFGQSALSLEELQAAAKSGNLDLQKASRAVADAQKNLKWESELSSTKASLSGRYASSVEAGQTSNFSGQASLTVPIIPQLSVGASVASSGTAAASISVSPFAAWRRSYAEKAAYDKAVADLTYASAKLGYDVENAAYGVMQAQASLTLAEESLPLKTELADIARKVYDMGELTYDDLETARSSLITARQSVFDAQKGLLGARVTLYRLLGPTAGQPGVGDVSVEGLLARIPVLDAEIAARRKSGQVGSLTLRKAEITLTSLKAELAATPVYRPSLGLSGQLSYDPTPGYGGASLSGSGSLTYSFSPSEIKTDDRAGISQSITETAYEIELERLALGLQASVSDQALAVARQVLETRTADLAQAEATLKEARLLLEQGERTSLEVEQARISAESARTRVFQAAAGVIDAQAAVLLAYVI